jgi:hypothetical protein
MQRYKLREGGYQCTGCYVGKKYEKAEEKTGEI